jgi:hypothetical protein
MKNFYLASTSSSPEIDFQFEERQLFIKGESYPENAAMFWNPVITELKQFLENDRSPYTIVINIALSYFNSSSTKMLFSLFEALDNKAKLGTNVIMNWSHDEEDDTIFEFGQELKEDFPHLIFHDHATKSI